MHCCKEILQTEHIMKLKKHVDRIIRLLYYGQRTIITTDSNLILTPTADRGFDLKF